MATETQTNISAQKNARNALQRVEQLEDTIPKVISSFSQALNQLQQQVTNAVEVLDAAISLLGPEQVQKTVVDARVTRARAEAESQKGQIAELVADGTLLADQVVTDKSIVVGQETREDGTLIEPGWFQHQFSQIKPEFQKELLGKGPGTEFKTANGNTYKLLEVYTVDEVKVKEKAEAAQKATDLAAATADETPPAATEVDPAPLTEEVK